MIKPVVFYGRVVSIDDPEQKGRIQVRIPEIHSNEISDQHLPWCYVMVGAPGSTKGQGVSPTGYVVGDEVAGFFRDQSMQVPVVCWTWSGDGDISPLVLGTNTDVTNKINDNRTSVSQPGVSFEEPYRDYGKVKYPHNVVETTRSGHAIERDDSPGNERLAWIHRLGSYFEFKPDGSVVDKSVSDRYEITDGDHLGSVGGDYRQSITGGGTIKYGASMYLKAADSSIVSDSSMLLKSANTVELQTMIMNVIAKMMVSEEITVPVLKAGQIICGSLQCASMVKGTVEYAMQAGRAGRIAPVSPPVPIMLDMSNLTTNPTIEDTDGE